MALHLDVETLVSHGLELNESQCLATRAAALGGNSPLETWKLVTDRLLRPEYPFAVHEYVYETTFAEWDHATLGPPPAWTPHDSGSSNIAGLMKAIGIHSYQELYQWSIRERAAFWDTMLRRLRIRVSRDYTRILDDSAGPEGPQWLRGARMNIIESCYSAPPDSTAIVYQTGDDQIRRVSVAELRSLSYKVADGLRKLSIEPGSCVAVAMPMTVEAAAIYLGAIAAGCTVATIADAFAPEQMKARLDITAPICVFTQHSIQRAGRKRPLFEKLKSAGAPKAIILGQHENGLRDGDLPWEAFLGDDDAFSPVCGSPGALTTILFSSGTTAEPKAIPWDHLTPIKAAADGYLHHDIHPGDVICWPTNLGWMMGPWLLFAALINRASVALYCGPPTSRQFGEFVLHAKVTMLGLVPSIVAYWRSSGCMQGLDWSHIRAFSSTGECSNPRDMLYLMSLAGYRPIIEYCGGTEIGGGYITGTVVQPCVPSTFSTPALGSELVVLDEQHRPTDSGEVFLVPPTLGLSQTLLNADHHQVYFAGVPRGPAGQVLRRHGDQLERLVNGYYRARGRVDDCMNLAGIKVSSAQIEEIVGTLEGVQEVAAVAVPPAAGGPSRLVVYAVPTVRPMPNVARLKSKMQRTVQERLSALVKIHEVVTVEALPRTASNKIMRRRLRAAYLDNESSR